MVADFCLKYAKMKNGGAISDSTLCFLPTGEKAFTLNKG
jgi:hypothetical protein